MRPRPPEDAPGARWVYCRYHLRPHVDERRGIRCRPVPLEAATQPEAYEEVRRHGWRIFGEEER